MGFAEGIRLGDLDGTTTPVTRALVMARHVISSLDDTPPMVRILLVISLVFATISVLTTLTTLYWFVRIRRNFRHELILLLIQSDLFKSLVFVIFPIVSFGWGSIESDSAFCQVSGFALAVGIESSDIAVLLIALHSAMYIFRPRSGLYPYRQYAYLVYYLFPVLAASLAFINGDGYENMGHYCYLRTDKSWARSALSWVPRYIICASIVIIYVFIYLYIRRRMGDYGRRRSEAMQQLGGSGRAVSVPRLCYHGLISSTPCSRRTSATDTISAAKDGLMPAPSTGRAGSARSSAEVSGQSGSVKWNWPGFTQPQASRPSVDDDTNDLVPPDSVALSPPPATHTHRPDPATTDDLRQGDYPGPFPSHHPSSATATTTTNPLDTEPSHTHHQHRRKKKTLRQLRSLFLYPLVYIIVWLFPFVSHILGYDDDSTHYHHRYYRASTHLQPHIYPDSSNKINTIITARSRTAREPPPWLLVISIISLCIQGAVYGGVFMARETPWRFAQGRGFLAGLGKRWVWWRRSVSVWEWDWRAARGRGVGAMAVGRTREEMLVDGRLARERRVEEVLCEVGRGRARGGGDGGREWWDVWEEGYQEDEEGEGDEDEEEQGLV